MTETDRIRLRRKQNHLIELAVECGYNLDTSISESYAGAPTVGELRLLIHPNWEGVIDNAIAQLEERNTGA